MIKGQANVDMRLYAAANGVEHWRIAEILGIHESVLSRKLRKELSPEDKDKFKAAVDAISSEVGNDK